MTTSGANGGVARYAIYWAPPADGPLWRFGSRWLGRDAETGAALAPDPAWPLDAATLRDATAEPRRYGLHATLKPPFRLADGRDAGDLERALADFAAGTAPVTAPPLTLRRLGRFLALVPDGPAPALQALAATVVERFDGFRAPAGAAELAKRRASGLTPAQDAHLVRWGYPYVMDQFRFHVTLSSGLDAAALDRFEAALRRLTAPFGGVPLTIDALALFAQPTPDAPFRLARRLPLAA